MKKRYAAGILIALSLIVTGSTSGHSRQPARFEIVFPVSLRQMPLDGRVLLILAKKDDKEPRFQIGEGLDTQQIFGADVDGLGPGQAAVIDESSQGYPRESLRDVPEGDYYLQAVLSVYETFHRADGHVLKFHMDQGEGQHWNSSPGNLMSEPKKIHIGGASDHPFKITLTKIIPPITPPKDNKYVKHFRIESKLLSKFWGRPMYIGGVVLLPDGFDEHPDARYPVIYYQGHFKESFATPVEFRDRPPTPELKGDDRLMAEYSYKFYQDWTSGRLPRMLIVSIQHANPYYDDSYAVNSVNVGPYGDAIVDEFMPHVEKTYRAIGQPWARVLTGGSTGGWEALAQQIFYPDVFNGSWCDCPDPVDFRAYQSIDIYKDKNAYWEDSDWKMVPRPSTRKPDDMLISTIQDDARWEATLGSHGRSTEQLDIWQAVFSPIGSDGYPKPIFDKRTGMIDHEVAQYWKEHYDLRYIMERDWKTLGPKLVGKLHIKVGTRDTYYLDRAVRLLETFLESTKEAGSGPYYAGDFDYGPYQPHCYSGDPSVPVKISRLTINQRYMPQMEAWMLKTAPKGADVKSWRY
ncbi:MAG TPA: hypothetical protein VNH83_06095 [Bryobacteraceae bacterium]|nr:hypothetical protein [Bryobacteraceae bacterium]